jgi:hypothetical protein
MLHLAILVATLLTALRGVILPFWDCTSFGQVIDRVMHLSETEWNGVAFGAVLACIATGDLVGIAARAAKRWRRYQRAE